jgi:hypothetical protein
VYEQQILLFVAPFIVTRRVLLVSRRILKNRPCDSPRELSSSKEVFAVFLACFHQNAGLPRYECGAGGIFESRYVIFMNGTAFVIVVPTSALLHEAGRSFK